MFPPSQIECDAQLVYYDTNSKLVSGQWTITILLCKVSVATKCGQCLANVDMCSNKLEWCLENFNQITYLFLVEERC